MGSYIFLCTVLSKKIEVYRKRKQQKNTSQCNVERKIVTRGEHETKSEREKKQGKQVKDDLKVR